MRAVCVSCLMSEAALYERFPDPKTAPVQAVQKYHRLLARGLAQNGADTVVLSSPPIMHTADGSRYIRIADGIERGVRYCYLPVVLLPVLKHIVTVLTAFFRALRLLNPDSFMLCDALNVSVSFGARMAAWWKRVPCIGIVTDVPDMLSDVRVTRKQRINRRLMSGYDAYLFLTEQMSALINKRSRPYLVLEGHADDDMRFSGAVPQKDAPPVLLYAGMLHARYGILRLAEAFKMTHLDAALVIYGTGDAEAQLSALAEEDARIRMMGVADNKTVVDAERRATLLINPRPSDAAFTKYSFPSKNMEYMVSGTPVLTTRLPGMPKEYEPYVYLFDGETPDEMAVTLQRVLAEGREALSKKGEAARAFMLSNKTNIKQAQRVLEFAACLRKKA